MMDRFALVTGTDSSLLLAYRAALGQLEYQVETIPVDQAPTRSFGVAIVDNRRHDNVQRLHSLAGRGLVLAVVREGQEIYARRHGADDIVPAKPPAPEELDVLLRAALDRLGRPVHGPFSGIIGRSEALQRVLQRCAQYANSAATVLLRGETGTGKEVFAQAIHQASPRHSGPMVALNCAAIPETLIESELFGHARGAFTGAVSARPGRIAAAEGGTLFLDEISEMALPAQAKLLRVLQEREYSPVGETRSRRADVRIIAATNRDLEQEVAQGRFRADLYWRLEVITIELPVMRERATDVLPLCHHFIDRTNSHHQHAVRSISVAAQQLLLSHHWPGNVRELENTVERAVILRGGGVLQLEDIILRRPQAPRLLTGVRLPPDGLDLTEITEELELLLIAQALEQTGGNRSQAARLLNINRTTLQAKLRRREGAAT